MEVLYLFLSLYYHLAFINRWEWYYIVSLCMSPCLYILSFLSTPFSLLGTTARCIEMNLYHIYFRSILCSGVFCYTSIFPALQSNGIPLTLFILSLLLRWRSVIWVRGKILYIKKNFLAIPLIWIKWIPFPLEGFLGPHGAPIMHGVFFYLVWWEKDEQLCDYA